MTPDDSCVRIAATGERELASGQRPSTRHLLVHVMRPQQGIHLEVIGGQDLELLPVESPTQVPQTLLRALANQH